MKNKLLLACCAAALMAAPAAWADTLSALGRVLPRSGIVDVAGTPGDTVQEIKVREGDNVIAGQSLAKLSSSDRAADRLQRAEGSLASVRKSTAEDLAIARSRVAMSEAEAKTAEDRYNRLAGARDSEFVSPDQLEERALGRQSSQLKLMQARQALEAAQRDADKAIQAAEADVTAARAQLALAEAHSPINARVLKSFARVGATVGRELFKIGDTSEMIVVAEVYEADALKVKPGQKVTITSAALPKKMTGKVTSVSQLIYRNSLETMDPNESSQARVVEVTVRMDEVSPLDRLVYLQVDVVIDL